MKKIYYKTNLIIGLIFALFFSACKDDIDPVIESLSFSRAFTPLNFEARVSNKTTVIFNWDVTANAASYVLEISRSADFSTIELSAEVTKDKVPYQTVLAGGVTFYARLKAISEAPEPSNWTSLSIATQPENIFESLSPNKIAYNSVTLSWPANSVVTHLLISPGNVQRNLSADEIATGKATVTGLSGESSYSVQIVNNSNVRGTISFTTYVDPSTGTVVGPNEDLSSVISSAASGALLLLSPGNYSAYTGAITLDKSLTIKGLLPYDTAVIHVQFVLANGASNLLFKDIKFEGNGTVENVIQCTTASTHSSVAFENCFVQNYVKSILSIQGTGVTASISNFQMNNCVVTNILTSSADCIDVRTGYVANLKLTNSTFNNCAPGRDFIRFDNSSASFPGSVSNTLIDHCTFYNVSSSARRVLYIRFVDNATIVRNSIFAGPSDYTGYYSNQAGTTQPVFSNNNYYNGTAFYTVSGTNKVDNSSSYTTLNPGFTDVAHGNFKISNENLIFGAIGDPRWID